MKSIVAKAMLGIMSLVIVFGVYCNWIIPSTSENDVKEESSFSFENEEYPFGTAGISSAMMNIQKESLQKNEIGVESNKNDVVQASYDNYEIPGKEPEPVIEYKEKDVSKDLYVNASTLNCRKEPNTDSEIVGTVGINEKVTTIKKVVVYIDGEKQKHTWYKLKDGSYVRSDYLSDEPVLEYLGEYRITYYCNCPICCDRWSYTTASGATTVEGVTCAADKSIPFGTKLLINDHIYTVQDRGGAIKGNHIDIYISSHKRALQQTYTRGPVYKVP